MNQDIVFKNTEAGLIVKLPGVSEEFKGFESLIIHDILHCEVIKYLDLSVEYLSPEEEAVAVAAQLCFDHNFKQVLKNKFEFVKLDFDDSNYAN
jgi:hypothetical protein